jgi:Acetoacetate decarboxylase (ADC)
MLQPDSMLPVVPRHPAPWNLRGSAWIIALKLPPGAPARDAFLPPGLAGRGRGVASYLMYVDYSESECGPYRELLFIPGAFPFGDGRRHLTISRIVVSTWDSVANGRDNWGIPKDRADFEVEQGLEGGREDRVRVVSEGRELCELRLATLRYAPSLPVPGGLLPARLRTLAQNFRGRTYYYAPSAGGRVRPGRLLSWRFNAALFPDLAGAAVLAALKVESFRMTFPVADVTG